MQTCSHCKFDNPNEAQFCQQCGQPLLHQCANCGTLNSPEAKFCMKCGTNLEADAQTLHEIRLETLREAVPEKLQSLVREARDEIQGQRKPVTILFADIVGSTAMAEGLDPEEWKEVVSGAHRRIGDAIYRYEGTVAQLLGDGVLAFFGAPLTHEDDPVRAIHTALGIQTAMREYERELKGLVEAFQMRIGINTGTVVLGDIGSDMHLEYLAVGDAVNLAARLQSAARPGKILLSETTARLAETEFELQDLGLIEVKGKSDPLPVFEVLRATPGRKVEGISSAFVGRNDELQIFKDTLNALLDGHGQILVVTGEAGIGKSRLLEEIRTRAGGKLHWLEGRSLSYGAGLSFWAITQLLLADLGLSEGEPEARIKVALRKRINEFFADETAEVLPYLEHLLGVKQNAQDEHKIQILDGETLKRQMIIALGDYFTRAAADSPTVLVFEDLHWADPSSLAALEQLFAITDRAALMLLLVTRVEREHASWATKLKAETDFGHRFKEISLNRLTAEESDDLVEQLLQVDEFPTAIHELILSRAEGNPFYLEEIIRHLIDNEVIRLQDDAWHVTEAIQDVVIPDTLQGVLLARIDRLEEDVRDTLQLASVIGKSFLYRLLDAIAQAELQLEAHLSQLQRVDLVREKARWPELEYTFKHALTQEAAYHSLLLERRKAFHIKVGEAIERLFADRREEFYGLLAHHFEAAEVNDKAITYLIQSGDKARLEDAQAEALAYYARALKLHSKTGDVEGEAKTWLKISLVHLKDFDFDAAHKAHEAAFDLRQRLRSDERRATILEETDSLDATVFRMLVYGELFNQELDPGKATDLYDGQVAHTIFAGLTQLDAAMNVVPHIARSWEVLEGGLRYVFHIRDDVFWSDGKRVTADDFWFSWVRNLAPETKASAAPLLDVIDGAREYREGTTSDPDSVGVRVLDEFTFEVRLSVPVPFFVFLVAHSMTFPVPRHTVIKYGDAWSDPEHIVSNGPFLVTKSDADRIEFVRNHKYFGDFTGNVGRQVWQRVDDHSNSMRAYAQDKADAIWQIPTIFLADGLASDEIQRPLGSYRTRFLVLNPLLAPLDDIRLRRALAHSIQRGSQFARSENSGGAQGNRGGIIPIGMPGHSPEIGFAFDLAKATENLRRAGFPEGKGLPKLSFGSIWLDPFRGLKQFWKDNLGIDTEFIELDLTMQDFDLSTIHVIGSAWIADYPDPDNFLRTSNIHDFLSKTGWVGMASVNELLDEALRSQNRLQRLEIYRRVDRLLVDEEVLVIPLSYGMGAYVTLVKPWVQGWWHDSMGLARIEETFIDPKSVPEVT